MSGESIVAISGGVLAAGGLLLVISSKAPKRVKRHHYVSKWRAIQQLCGDKQNWPEAIVSADALLDEVLRKKRKPGKSTGERLVAARNTFTNNDALWQAHKLANHIRHSDAPTVRLREKDVKAALVSFMQALRDLGAI